MILPRYEEAFASLSPDELQCCVEDLAVDHPELYELGDLEDGLQLLQYCRDSGISQAEVILCMRRDTRLPAIGAVERLLMRPIDRRSPAEVERERDAARPRPVPVAPPRSTTTLQSDDRVIRVLVTENPKRVGSKSHDRFRLYRDGMSVGDYIRAGGSMADLVWDSQRSFIRVEDPA